MTLTPPGNEKGSIARYTQAEKDILFDLFKEYEEVIDIKHRKKSRRKTLEVRQCWQEILDAYNNAPQITTQRNLKQLQKFWLNARLRKRLPFSRHESSPGNKISIKQIFQPLKSEDSIMEICTASPPNYQQEDEVQPTVVQDSSDRRIKYEIQVLNSSNEMTIKDQSTNDPRQISIETISNDNISLNDLLEFKNSRQNPPVLEIKSVHQTPTVHRNRFVSVDDDQGGSTTIIYSANTSDGCDERSQENTVLVDRDATVRKKRPANSSTQTSCTCLDDVLRKVRIKEAELKLKEQELRTEKQKVELARSQEELRHLKEMNELTAQEMRIKLKILEKSISRDKD